MHVRVPSKRARRWISWGAFAVVDQGLISGSNFALAILLARWSSQDEYGAYAVAFGIFVLLSQLHQATILEPMSVFGGSIFSNQIRHYLGILLWLHLFLSIVSVLAFGAGVAIAGYFGAAPALVHCLVALTLSSPMVLLLLDGAALSVFGDVALDGSLGSSALLPHRAGWCGHHPQVVCPIRIAGICAHGNRSIDNQYHAVGFRRPILVPARE